MACGTKICRGRFQRFQRGKLHGTAGVVTASRAGGEGVLKHGNISSFKFVGLWHGILTDAQTAWRGMERVVEAQESYSVRKAF